MVDIVNGELQYNELNARSNGGTELLARQLQESMPKELLKEFQIVLSRKRELLNDKIRIFWAHDLPGDPESEFLKDPNNHNLFHRYVFVSNWQMQAYIQSYGLPWSKCLVLQNFIEPIPAHEKPNDRINLVYFSTPHRGLQLLVPVFEKLAERYDNIHLHVFSSFGLYGWEQRDKPYEKLFDQIHAHERMNYYGAVSNEVIREELKNMHILAYPSIWPETSCLVLMESMSAGLLCAHSNFAALPETAANWTMMYQYHESANQHANLFYTVLDTAIQTLNTEDMQASLRSMKSYADIFYRKDLRMTHWHAYLQSLVANITDRSLPPPPEEVFTYKR